ncbi:hypothetical protein [Roseateles amylovorans]|uniref:Uncharacterized protein n=1 Tax=Roseateles amylovorans TaxID=2978473 RepID=A0ABY6B3U2_9BURK|nr:hypothetical protein [Roseateles amylovorans]UXH80043.1 hypothetical protein N4261_09250 [Roseateles amylovorans]
MIENKAFPPFGHLEARRALWRHAAFPQTTGSPPHKPLQTSTDPVDNFVEKRVSNGAKADFYGVRIGLPQKTAEKIH